MRKLVASLQICALLLAPLAHAGDSAETQALKVKREQVRKHFPGYIDNMYRAYVFSELSWRYQDFASVLSGLTIEADGASARSRRAIDEWTHAYHHAFALPPSGSAGIEDSLVELATAMSTVRREARRLEIVRDDLKILTSGWENRCGRDRLDSLYSRYRPGHLFAPDRLDLRASGTNFVVGLQVSAGATTGVQPPAIYDETRGIIVTMSAAVGAKLAASALAGGLVGGIAAMVVIMVIDALDWAAEQSKQEDAIEEIRNIQKGKIARLDADAPSQLEGFCSEFQPESVGGFRIRDVLDSRVASVSAMAEQAVASLVEMSVSVAKLESKLKLELETVVARTLSETRERFVSNLEEADGEMDRLQDGLQSFLPSISADIRKKQTAVGVADKARADQDIWDRMIEAEARFAPSGAFKEFSIWNALVEKVRKEIAP